MNEPKFGNGRPLSLRARVSGALAAILEETPIAADQRLKPECAGAHRLSATIPERRQLNGWIPQQGAGLEVPSPKALREGSRQPYGLPRAAIAEGRARHERAADPFTTRVEPGHLPGWLEIPAPEWAHSLQHIVYSKFYCTRGAGW
jgi:hypothetical protein